MLPGYPAGVAATSPPYPTPRGVIPWGDPACTHKLFVVGWVRAVQPAAIPRFVVLGYAAQTHPTTTRFAGRPASPAEPAGRGREFQSGSRPRRNTLFCAMARILTPTNVQEGVQFFSCGPWGSSGGLKVEPSRVCQQPDIFRPHQGCRATPMRRVFFLITISGKDSPGELHDQGIGT